MIFQCSGLELDTERFSITRDGQPVSVAPKVFDLLVFLMRHRDRLVTRDELLNELWPGRVVHENVLSNDIKLARAVLGDDGVQQKAIKTIRGRGYQFVGEVREIVSTTSPTVPANDTPSSAPEAGSSFFGPRSLLITVAVLFAGVLTILWLREPTEPATEPAAVSSPDSMVAAPVTMGPKTIAILPFANRSNLEQDAYFVDGFHDDLITQVSQIKDLSTISRTSVMAYRDSSKSMRTIGNELGSGIIIEGGVQRAGEQVRINVQMIDAAKDAHIWAETYTRELSAESVFAIQSEIALDVASQLKAVLSPQEQENIAKLPTRNMAALEAYFRGQASFHLNTSEALDHAIAQYRQAIELDPDFAEAHAQLGSALLEKIDFGGLPVNDQIALAEPVIERALQLNPKLSQAYEALAFLERSKGNFAATEAAYEKAIKLNPGNANAIRMFAVFKSQFLAQHQQALALMNRAMSVDPQNPHTLFLQGFVLVRLDRFEEARDSFNATIASEPDFFLAHAGLGELYHQKFYQHDQAIKAYRRFYFLDPGTSWNFLRLANAYEDVGLADEAVRYYERYLEFNQDGIPSDIARLRLHIVQDNREQVKRVLGEIKDKFAGEAPWIDVMLGGFDLHQGNPALVIERIEATYPELMSADADIVSDPARFNLAIAYATALHQSGKKEQAAPLTKRILEGLPSQSRHRWGGVQTLDTWLHVAMGNDDKAIQSLREWRAIGGRVDLTKHRMVPDSLFDHPEFQAINNEILAELAEQRANLSRMEAAGELAPIPES